MDSKCWSGFQGILVLAVVLWLPHAGYTAESETYRLGVVVVNSGGNTYCGTTQRLFDSIGEAGAGQVFGARYSIQSGFFNDYFLPAPTPTITCTPIRYFDGEIINPEYVYAAPNPMRGIVGHIYFDLAVPAEVTIKVFTTSSALVISRHWDALPAGTNHWAWETSNLANGVYLLRIKAQGVDGRITIVTKKLALVK